MPVAKIKAGKGTCQSLRRYLLGEDGGRALAVDLYNLGEWSEPAPYVDEEDEERRKGYDWARDMDMTRRELGHDKVPYNGKAPRSYVHAVISPKKDEAVDLPALRELVRRVIADQFPYHEVAVVYHDDNEGHILHAHLQVNVSDLCTLKKLHMPSKHEFNRRVQDIAREMGVAAFDNRFPGQREAAGTPAGATPDERDRAQAFTKWDLYPSRAERRVAMKGGDSWKADLRQRVIAAMVTSTDVPGFKERLAQLGVTVRPNSPKARRRDWVYALADAPTRCAAGEKLGYTYGRTAVERRFERQAAGMVGTSRPLDSMSADEFARVAARAVRVHGVEELREVARALEEIDRYNVQSVQALDDKARLYAGRYGEGCRACRELRAARRVIVEKGLLPKTHAEYDERRARDRGPDFSSLDAGIAPAKLTQAQREARRHQLQQSIRQHVQRERDERRGNRGGKR